MTTKPEIPPPPWQRTPERPARRRRDPISREAIVAAAVQLLDREGLAALSMRKLADDLRAASLRHPWVVRVSIGRIPMGPNALRYSEAVLAILRAGGLPPHLAVQGYLLLIATVNGFTIDETGVDDGADARDGSMSLDPDSLQEIADMASDYVASLPADRFPNMTALAGEFAFSDPDERFELLIDIFVDGLARRAAQP